MHQVHLYTDGACAGNPGLAGIGVVLISGKHRKEFSLPIGQGTNNIAEIRAVIEGIDALTCPKHTDVILHTDSQLVEGFLTKGWRPKANQELIAQLQQRASRCHSLRVVKVKAHNGRRENERCHTLARRASAISHHPQHEEEKDV